MVNDRTIDKMNATFWCAFMDDKLLAKLDEAASYDAEDGKKLAKIVNKVGKKMK